MRLIRLTSNSSDGIIENNFQAEILVKENSQIALDSLTTEVSPSTVVIDAANDTITFTIEEGESKADKSIVLTHGTYGGETEGARTYEQLLDQIQTLMNESLSTWKETGTGKMIGSEYKVFYNGQGKTEIAVSQAPNTAISVSNQGTWEVENVSLNANGQVVKRGGTGAPGDLDSYMYQPIRLARGGGKVRARVGTSTVGSDESDSGFIIGVSTTNPALWAAGNTLDDLSEVAYGIQFVDKDTVYQTIEDGVLTATTTDPAEVGATYGDNDIVQIGYRYDDSDDASYLSLGVIQTDGSQEIFEDIEFDASIEYYPIIIFLGSNDASVAGACSIGTIRAYTNPYDSRTRNVSVSTQMLGDGLGANQALVYQGATVQIYYNFKTKSVSNYLGYINMLSGNLSYSSLRSYIGTFNAYASSEQVDNFIFELLNLDLNSYDGLSQQRKNYLSTIPATASVENVVSYKTSYPIFLNLSNKQPFTIRNIQARLLTFGGSSLSVRGQTTATILIRDGDDR